MGTSERTNMNKSTRRRLPVPWGGGNKTTKMSLGGARESRSAGTFTRALTCLLVAGYLMSRITSFISLSTKSRKRKLSKVKFSFLLQADFILTEKRMYLHYQSALTSSVQMSVCPDRASPWESSPCSSPRSEKELPWLIKALEYRDCPT